MAPRFEAYAGAQPQGAKERTPVESAFIQTWDGGWQPDKGVTQLQPNEVADLLNMQFTEGYGLKKRKGFQVITDNITGMDTAEHILIRGVSSIESSWVVFEQHVYYFNEDDGAIYHQTLANLVEEFDDPADGADLVDTGWARGAWTLNQMGERAWSHSAVVYGDDVYITGLREGATSADGVTDQSNSGLGTGVSKAFKHNVQANTWSAVANPDLSGESTGFPAARTVITLHDRMFAANILRHTNLAGSLSLNYRYPNRIYWSNPGTAETWDENSFVTVGSDDDGSEIVALVPFRTGILVFKNHSTWVLTGTDEDTFALYSVSTGLGCEATYGVAVDEDFCYFIDVEEGIMQYDGVRFENISLPFNNELLTDLNRDAIFKSVAWLDEDKLYMSVPVGDFASGIGDHATRTYVYDRDLKVWSKWNIGYVPTPALYTQDSGNLDAPSPDGSYYGGGIADTTGVMQLGTTDSDNGSAITAYFETAWLQPGEVGDLHRLRRFEVLTTVDNDEIDVSLYKNFSTSAYKTGTFTPATGTLDAWHEQQGQYDTELWSWLQVRLGNNDIGETFEVQGLAFTYSTRQRKRNDLGLTAGA